MVVLIVNMERVSGSLTGKGHDLLQSTFQAETLRWFIVGDTF